MRTRDDDDTERDLQDTGAFGSGKRVSAPNPTPCEESNPPRRSDLRWCDIVQAAPDAGSCNNVITRPTPFPGARAPCL